MQVTRFVSRSRVTPGNKARRLSAVWMMVKVSPDGDRDPPWLLVTEEGLVYTWRNRHANAVEYDCWHAGERPALVNDFALIRRQPTDKVRGLFLATDQGVHLIRTVEEDPEHREREHMANRVALQGLGSVCMALTYVEDELSGDTNVDKTRYRYLWAVDAAGTSHLFCGHRAANHLNLQSSGLSQLGSQVVLAVAGWQGADERDPAGELVCVQVQRDDHVRVGHYRFTDTEGDGACQDSIIQLARRALSFGNHISIPEMLSKIEHARFGRPGEGAVPETDKSLPSADEFSELMQVLAEGPETRRVLDEFLSNPNANDSGPLLDSLGTEDALRTLDLWTVSFLGGSTATSSRTNVPDAQPARGRATQALGSCVGWPNSKTPAASPAVTCGYFTALRPAPAWSASGGCSEANRLATHSHIRSKYCVDRSYQRARM